MNINGGMRIGTVVVIAVLFIGSIAGYVRTQDKADRAEKGMEQIKLELKEDYVKKEAIKDLKELTKTKFENQKEDIEELKMTAKETNRLLIELIKEVKANNKSDK